MPSSLFVVVGLPAPRIEQSVLREMDGLAVATLHNGDSIFGLALEYLHPADDLDTHAVTRDMVALISSLEGQVGSRAGLQVVGRPEPKAPELGVLDVHVLGVVAPQGDPSSTLQAVHTADR